MRKRHFVAVGLALILGWFSINLMFPRLHNNISCDDVVPSNPGESAALVDARSRKSSVCSGSHARCRFWLSPGDDDTIQVSLDLVRSDFFEGCVVDGYDDETLVYSRDGKFVRVDPAPFGLD